MNDRLVWVDCEMTGLDPATDVLVEVAALVTDADLQVLGDGVNVIIATPQDKLDGMLPVVREMHEQSGLLAALAGATATVADAEAAVLDYVRTWVPEPNKAPLCGNSIATDRSFLARFMPELDGWLHYRMVDVSSIKELVRRWYPKVYFALPEKRGGHRALADILESVAELRYYRRTVFVPPPGPDTDTARAAAAEPAPPLPGTVAPD